MLLFTWGGGEFRMLTWVGFRRLLDKAIFTLQWQLWWTQSK